MKLQKPLDLLYCCAIGILYGLCSKLILKREDYDTWIDPGMKDVATLTEMLKPFDAQSMSAYPVSTRINHAANDDEDCALPIELDSTLPRGRLFP